MRYTNYRSLGLIAVSAGALACSDPSGVSDEGEVQVRAFARGLDQTMSSTGAEVAAVRIDRVLFVLGRVKLETGGSGTVDFVDERSVVLELPGGDAPILAVTSNVPRGQYKEIELAIDKLETGNPSEQSLIQSFPSLNNASILVEGTVTRSNGAVEPFSFVTDLDIDLEVALDPSVTVGGGQSEPLLLSVVLDASSWFRNQSGQVIDPTRTSNRSMIEGAIQRSIELFEDADHDGQR